MRKKGRPGKSVLFREPRDFLSSIGLPSKRPGYRVSNERRRILLTLMVERPVTAGAVAEAETPPNNRLSGLASQAPPLLLDLKQPHFYQRNRQRFICS